MMILHDLGLEIRMAVLQFVVFFEGHAAVGQEKIRIEMIIRCFIFYNLSILRLSWRICLRIANTLSAMDAITSRRTQPNMP